MKISLRIIFFIPALLAISFLSFFFLELRPGNFLTTLEFSSAQQEAIFSDLTASQIGFIHKYFYWLSQVILHQNWGISFLYNQPVFDLIYQYLGPTLLFTSLIMVFKWLISLPLALLSSSYDRGKFSIIQLISQVAISCPEFLSAILLLSLAIFYPFLMNYLFLIGVLAGTFHSGGILYQLLCTRFEEIQKQPFYRHLQLTGLPTKKEKEHLLRHAWPQICLVFSQDLPSLFSGGLIISMIFNIQTLGPFFQQAILSHDTNLVMGIVMFLAILMQLGYIISDALLLFERFPLQQRSSI